MPDRVIRIFLASPGDVATERKRVNKVVDRVNQELGDALGISLQVLKWETNAIPAMGRAQSHITPLVDRCDIFVGILWSRFGSPPGPTQSGQQFESGTEEEFYAALRSWEASRNSDDPHPWIMMYFSERPLSPGKVDTGQVSKVSEFKQRFGSAGPHPGLFATYSNLTEFEHAFHRHLLGVVLRATRVVTVSDVYPDFVAIRPDVWNSLFARTQTVDVMCMYGNTWRNTYLNSMRDVLRRGGRVRVLLPDPDPANVNLEQMAARMGEGADALRRLVTASADEYRRLGATVRFSSRYYTHGLYLFDIGAVIALFSYHADRRPTPAMRVGPGPSHDLFRAEFNDLFDPPVPAPYTPSP